jgi:DnaJ like chaperone protein
MNWWGKIFGGAFGFLVGGPIGALLGATVGHTFDRGLKGIERDPPGGAGARQRAGWQWGGQRQRRERAQAAFFAATFAVMGRLAKVDGRVSRNEIEVAEAVMRQMRFTSAQRETAIRLFNEGKSPDFDLDGVVGQFRDECRRHPSLIQFFLEIQIEAAHADGEMTRAEEEVLLHICRILDFPVERFRLLVRMMRGGRRAHRESSRRPGEGGQQHRPGVQGMSLADAYSVLGVNREASNDEVKKAYRRLMSQHHPDKLVSRGLPDEMIEKAKEKSQDISRAYEIIRAQRGL